MTIEQARLLSQTLLYEGYILWPYRANALKNNPATRFQFGVLMPQLSDPQFQQEPYSASAHILIEAPQSSTLTLYLRFLQLQSRTVEKKQEDQFVSVDQLQEGKKLLIPWDEAIEHEYCFCFPLNGFSRGGEQLPMEIPAKKVYEEFSSGRIMRSSETLQGLVQLFSRQIDQYCLLKIQWHNLKVLNSSLASKREILLKHAFLSVNILCQLSTGKFISLANPPAALHNQVQALKNQGLWPILLTDQLLLVSPIIIEDYPKLAPESHGQDFDATEIEELLALSTLCLTPEEKQWAKATDPKANELIERWSDFNIRSLTELHGTIRKMEEVSEDYIESLCIENKLVKTGSLVKLQPQGRADACDLFYNQKIARVEEIRKDVEGNYFIGVTLVEDPGAEVFRWYGRFLYFKPNEILPL
ncbi:hypothetical protein A946_08625 [Methylacidiphilum kamchatkense Kam1]|uniref:Uncharacterized protein n=1 Tax=Methylacidiphilum kamchatkense Kam1 TaxID=1202785 RepID=A0A0C1V3D8_9BACT|nr:hypothetical protein [Methylacidiphilum kamchatkense]KIE58220.1 hypothetical protein A946_08625 [Methylacidiphilum kamchatkense Kam1]QDQ42068.1 hypothetical protein kam1_825 [Methylacidiphilum kamchatkense Kam1]